jgi:hypothetical protein
MKQLFPAVFFLITCLGSGIFICALHFLILSGRQLRQAKMEYQNLRRKGGVSSIEINDAKRRYRNKGEEHRKSRHVLIGCMVFLIAVVELKVLLLGRSERNTLFYVHVSFVSLFFLCLVAQLTFYNGKKKASHPYLGYGTVFLGTTIAVLGVCLSYTQIK